MRRQKRVYDDNTHNNRIYFGPTRPAARTAGARARRGCRKHFRRSPRRITKRSSPKMLIGFRRRSVRRSRVSRDRRHSGHVARPYLHTHTHTFSGFAHGSLRHFEFSWKFAKRKREVKMKKNHIQTIGTLPHAHVPKEDYFTFNDRTTTSHPVSYVALSLFHFGRVQYRNTPL